MGSPNREMANWDAVLLAIALASECPPGQAILQREKLLKVSTTISR